MEKTVLITGGSRGIGRAAVALFARSGWRVLMNYLRSETEALELAESLKQEGHTVLPFRADVTASAQVEAMVETCLTYFHGIDALINNAGISSQALFTDISPDSWNEMLNVHVNGMYHCCRSVVPHMLSKKRGSIINVSSIWGMTGAACEVHYSTAKAAVIGFTRALAKEMGPSGIRVNCVAPGIVQTEMNAFLGEDEADALRAQTPLLRFGTPEEIARTMLFLASDDADFITGQVISPNGGLVI
jgi:3-oxoacyl-[acyl-carrier protein] reductase